MKKKQILIYSFFLVSVLIAVLWIFKDIRDTQFYRIHNEILWAHGTKWELDFLSTLVIEKVYDKGNIPLKDIQNLVQWLEPDYENKEVYKIIYNNTMESLSYLRIQNNQIIDRWNNSIQLNVESPHHYTFLSYGPNGKDDQGEKDDIAYSFDPLSMLEKYKNKAAEVK